MNTKNTIHDNVAKLIKEYAKHGGRIVKNTPEHINRLALFFEGALQDVKIWAENNPQKSGEEKTTIGQYLCKKGLGTKQDWFGEDCVRIQKFLTYKDLKPSGMITTTLGNFESDYNMALRYNTTGDFDMFLTIGENVSIYIENGKAKIGLL